jgi:hypothetical protein
VLVLAVSALDASFTYPPVWIGTTPFNHDNAFVSPSLGCVGDTPQGTGGAPNYCPLINRVIPNVDFVLLYITWTVGTGLTTPDAGFENTTLPVSNPPPPSQYTFTNLDADVFSPLAALTCATNLGRPHPCWMAIIVSPRIDGNVNTNAPPYIYNQGAGTWPDMVAPAWTAGQQYLTGQTVTFGGQFWQLSTQISCVPIGTLGPSSPPMRPRLTWPHAARMKAPDYQRTQPRTFSLAPAGQARNSAPPRSCKPVCR